MMIICDQEDDDDSDTPLLNRLHLWELLKHANKSNYEMIITATLDGKVVVNHLLLLFVYIF